LRYSSSSASSRRAVPDVPLRGASILDDRTPGTRAAFRTPRGVAACDRQWQGDSAEIQLLHHRCGRYKARTVTREEAAPWLVLFHQLPPKPAYLRVKVWRRLQALGAVALKNSVYVLPRAEQTREDFEWLVREIAREGGEATVCEARFTDGLNDQGVEALFVAARDAEYHQIADEARDLERELSPRKPLSEEQTGRVDMELVRLRRRLAEVVAIDFFGSPGREVAEAMLTSLASRLAPAARLRNEADPDWDPARLDGRTWVTRKGIHIDRIACAWLIQRFVDPRARFKFVSQRGYRPESDEIRFDMFEGEFTHEGDLCTFEVLCARLRLSDPALRPIAEIVHDIDLKDEKFGRPEVAGVDHLVAGLAMARHADEERLARGREIFEDLYEYFRRKRG